MRINNFKKSSYKAEVASKYINPEKLIRFASSYTERQYRYEDGKNTGEITGYKYWFVQEGLNPFVVKFEKELDVIKFLDPIVFIGLEGIEIKTNVYFRARNLEVQNNEE